VRDSAGKLRRVQVKRRDANGLLLETPAGTGPGSEGCSENSGRASSMKEKVGTAEESTTPRAPGIAGAGGWVSCDG
jgi:hypothetical protein